MWGSVRTALISPAVLVKRTTEAGTWGAKYYADFKKNATDLGASSSIILQERLF